MSRPISAGSDSAAVSAKPAVERLRPFHWRIAALASLAFAGNGVDAGVVSFALPGVRAEWGLSPSDLAFVLPVLGIGQLVGAVLVGSLADRFGRRLTFAGTAMLAGGGTGLAGLAPDPVVLALLFLLGGIGFGGVAPVAGALVSEFSPPAYRGQLIAWTQVLWVVGWCGAGLGGGWFEQQLGWRGILGLGALPIVIGLIGLLLVPESPRFLISRGRREEALALSSRLAERHGIVIPVGQSGAAHRGSPIAHLAELWGPTYRRRTIALWTAWAAMMAAFAGPVLWLPVLMQGLGSTAALQMSALVGFSMLPASLASVAFIDRSGRKPLMLASLGAATIGAFAVALGKDAAVVVVGAIGVAGGTLAAWPVVLSWASEQFPTRMRASASGWAAGAARLGSVGAPALVGLLLGPGGEGRAAAMLPFALLLAGAVASVAFFGEETAGRSLEELSS